MPHVVVSWGSRSHSGLRSDQPAKRFIYSGAMSPPEFGSRVLNSSLERQEIQRDVYRTNSKTVVSSKEFGHDSSFAKKKTSKKYISKSWISPCLANNHVCHLGSAQSLVRLLLCVMYAWVHPKSRQRWPTTDKPIRKLCLPLANPSGLQLLIQFFCIGRRDSGSLLALSETLKHILYDRLWLKIGPQNKRFFLRTEPWIRNAKKQYDTRNCF